MTDYFPLTRHLQYDLFLVDGLYIRGILPRIISCINSYENSKAYADTKNQHRVVYSRNGVYISCQEYSKKNYTYKNQCKYLPTRSNRPEFSEAPSTKWCFYLVRFVEQVICDYAYVTDQFGELRHWVIFSLFERISIDSHRRSALDAKLKR